MQNRSIEFRLQFVGNVSYLEGSVGIKCWVEKHTDRTFTSRWLWIIWRTMAGIRTYSARSRCARTSHGIDRSGMPRGWAVLPTRHQLLSWYVEHGWMEYFRYSSVLTKLRVFKKNFVSALSGAASRGDRSPDRHCSGVAPTWPNWPTVIAVTLTTIYFLFQTHCFLVCYSVGSRPSYENVVHKWYPELKHFSESVPIVLVGKTLNSGSLTIKSVFSRERRI